MRTPYFLLLLAGCATLRPPMDLATSGKYCTFETVAVYRVVSVDKVSPNRADNTARYTVDYRPVRAIRGEPSALTRQEQRALRGRYAPGGYLHPPRRGDLVWMGFGLPDPASETSMGRITAKETATGRPLQEATKLQAAFAKGCDAQI